MAVDDPNLEERIEAIYQERYWRFCRVATGVTGSAEVAYEAVQEGFARALARRGEFRGDGPLEGWLWRIILHAALDSRRREPPVPVDAADETAVLWSVELPHPDRDPELDRALRALPAKQRLVVFLRYFADLSHAEIAELSGMRLGTVSATLHQARATLAKRLESIRPADKELRR